MKCLIIRDELNIVFWICPYLQFWACRFCVPVCVCVCVCLCIFTETSLWLWPIFTDPDQQPPPQYRVLNTTALRLFWNPPDYPNGIIQKYVLYRDNTVIATLDSDSMCIIYYYTYNPYYYHYYDYLFIFTQCLFSYLHEKIFCSQAELTAL